MEENELRRMTQIEMFLIGLILGAVIMFAGVFLQFKTGLFIGDYFDANCPRLKRC